MRKNPITQEIKGVERSRRKKEGIWKMGNRVEDKIARKGSRERRVYEISGRLARQGGKENTRSRGKRHGANKEREIRGDGRKFSVE